MYLCMHSWIILTEYAMNGGDEVKACAHHCVKIVVETLILFD